jgi:hypothetical protein
VLKSALSNAFQRLSLVLDYACYVWIQFLLQRDVLILALLFMDALIGFGNRQSFRCRGCLLAIR